MHILFPGRHHLLTQFQFDYLTEQIDHHANSDQPIKSVIFAVTSANHSQTRRNPLPLYLRAMAIQEFASELSVPGYVFHIDDVGVMKNFAGYTVKRIRSQSNNRLHLTPQNTLVLCSTPSVIRMYRHNGFDILPAELINDEKPYHYQSALPWEVVESITGETTDLGLYQEKAHCATQALWDRYQLIDNIRMLFQDRMLGDDGDLTETRDYNSYVRQMDENIDFKFNETGPFIQPGRIGDIGCAVGSWIRKATEQPLLAESDFFGVEVSRHLFDICEHRKSIGEFSNPCVFFTKRNAVAGLVFPAGSMDTIHTSSLTHEIFSYIDTEDLDGKDETAAIDRGLEQLRAFIRNRFEELNEGGVWINRDVVGPEDGQRLIHMTLDSSDGSNEEAETSLAEMSTYARFKRFATDYRKQEGHKVEYREVERNDTQVVIEIELRDAWEYATKKDYTENWKSEMNERFCFWSYSDWYREMQAIGFKIDSTSSQATTNPWIVDNRLIGKVALNEIDGSKIEYPPTGMVLVASRTIESG